jgi:pyrroline-5-carboxylate reductase
MKATLSQAISTKLFVSILAGTTLEVLKQVGSVADLITLQCKIQFGVRIMSHHCHWQGQIWLGFVASH